MLVHVMSTDQIEIVPFANFKSINNLSNDLKKQTNKQTKKQKQNKKKNQKTYNLSQLITVN